MNDRVKWAKRVFGSIFGIAVAIVLIIGLLCAKVIEGSLFAEIAKWVVIAAIVGGIVTGLAYVPVMLLGHKREDLYPKYGKKWFWTLLKKNK